MYKRQTEQDAKIAGIAHERGKGMIIAVNKWDAIEKDDKTIYRFTEKVKNTLSFMPVSYTHLDVYKRQEVEQLWLQL